MECTVVKTLYEWCSMLVSCYVRLHGQISWGGVVPCARCCSAWMRRLVTSLLCLRDAGTAQHGIVAQMVAHSCASQILAARTHTHTHTGTPSDRLRATVKVYLQQPGQTARPPMKSLQSATADSASPACPAAVSVTAAWAAWLPRQITGCAVPDIIPVFTREWPIPFPGIRERQSVQDSRESGKREPGNGHRNNYTEVFRQISTCCKKYIRWLLMKAKMFWLKSFATFFYFTCKHSVILLSVLSMHTGNFDQLRDGGCACLIMFGFTLPDGQ